MRRRLVQLGFEGFSPSGDRPVIDRLAPRRSRTKAPSPAPLPWDAVVLGIDTARRSGWAIAVQGKRVDSGELDTLDAGEVQRVVAWAVSLGALGRLPVVLVLEAPWGGSVSVVAALGAARERWMAAWRACGQSPRRVVRVQASTWRCGVLGRVTAGMEREAVRALEQSVANRLAGKALGPDEAPACLIAYWGGWAGQVGKVIGVRARKASLRKWTGKK